MPAADTSAYQLQQDAGFMWLVGLESLSINDPDQARDIWNDILHDDPSCADALLGLHSISPGDSGLLQLLYAQVKHLGEQQEKWTREIKSVYFPGGFISSDLSSGDDVRRALALHQGRTDDGAEALRLLEECSNNAITHLVRARVYFELERYSECIRELNDPQTYADLPKAHLPELDLMHGACLLAGGDLQAAIDTLTVLLSDSESANQKSDQSGVAMHTRYYLAAAYRENGQKQASRECYRAILNVDPDFADAEYQMRHQDIDHQWDTIVASFNSGDLAEDSSIPDNLQL